MTPRDFLDSVIYSDQDFKSNMRRRKVSSQELGKMLDNGKFFTKMCSSFDIIGQSVSPNCSNTFTYSSLVAGMYKKDEATLGITRRKQSWYSIQGF